MTNNLSLKQLESLGISKYMSDQELEKNIAKALLEQQQSLSAPYEEHKEKLPNLDDVLVNGGLFKYKYNGKLYNINVLTPDDLNLLSNIDNLNEQGVSYEIEKPHKYWVRNSVGNYLTIKCKDYKIAQEIVDIMFGSGAYHVSASKL